MDPDDRRRLALVLVEAGVTLAVAWVLHPTRPPLRPAFWHAVMRASQSSARQLGQLGMRAELRYRQEATP